MAEEGNEELGTFEMAKAEAREKYRALPLNELILKQRELQEWIEDVKERTSIAQARYDVLRMEMIPKLMEEQGIKSPYSISTAQGTLRVSLTSDMFVSTKPGEQAGLFKWLSSHKAKSLIKPTVNASTLKAFIKERWAKNLPIPSEFVNVSPYTRASITKK